MKKIIFLVMILMIISSCGVIQRANMRRAIRNSGGSCEYIQNVGEVCAVPIRQ